MRGGARDNSGRPPGHRNANGIRRDIILRLRVSEEEREEIKRRARDFVTVAEYMRSRVLGGD